MPSQAELEVLALSLKVAFWGLAGSLPFAVAIAFVLARKSFPGKTLFDAVVHLPLVLPPVVVGYALLVLFGTHGPIGRLLEPLGIVFAFRWTGAEVAARTLGARRSRVFFTVTLPLALPGVVTGSLLTFARALGEFGATITFVSNIPGETRTLPLAIYAATQVPGRDAVALRLALLSVAVSLAALVVSEWLVRRAARKRHA
jgi:molybdate transport system permease protein